MTLHTYDGVLPLYERTPPASFTRGRPAIIPIGGELAAQSTSSAERNRCWDSYERGFDATTSGRDKPNITTEPGQLRDESTNEATRMALAQLRRISGLTWEQLGQLFGVSRRSVHFWASGKPLNAEHEAQLLQVLDIVRTADRGSSRATRTALFEVKQGTSAFDLLLAKRFAEASARLGDGMKPQPRQLNELSAEAQAARLPLQPEELVGAMNDRVHQEPGRARAARTVRNTRRETT